MPPPSQASQLKFLLEKLLEKLLEAVPSAPPELLQGLNDLCLRRVEWPDGVLYPSEAAALQPPEADGSRVPSASSPARLLLQIVGTRVLLHGMLLLPHEHDVAKSKPPAKPQASRQMRSPTPTCARTRTRTRTHVHEHPS